MDISIKTIPHKKQRYDTPGDWFFDKYGNLHIHISSLGNWKYEVLIALHEVIEVTICKLYGIKQSDVDAFDIQFEKERKKGLHKKDEEPGDHPLAPYRFAHFFATSIERLMAGMLKVDWNDYADAVEAL